MVLRVTGSRAIKCFTQSATGGKIITPTIAFFSNTELKSAFITKRVKQLGLPLVKYAKSTPKALGLM